jgi:hypothetical protein
LTARLLAEASLAGAGQQEISASCHLVTGMTVTISPSGYPVLASREIAEWPGPARWGGGAHAHSLPALNEFSAARGH